MLTSSIVLPACLDNLACQWMLQMPYKKKKLKKVGFFVFISSIGLLCFFFLFCFVFFRTDMYHEALCQLCFFQIDFPMGTF